MYTEKYEIQLHWSSVIDQSCLSKRQSEREKNRSNQPPWLMSIQKADRYMIIGGEENGLLSSPYCQFWQFCCCHGVLVLFQNPAWKTQVDIAVSLWVSRAKHQLHPRRSSWPFCSDSQERRNAHMYTWFSASLQRFRYDRKCLFSCIYDPQITVLPTSSFSASFNGNHPLPWTCPLIPMDSDCIA